MAKHALLPAGVSIVAVPLSVAAALIDVAPNTFTKLVDLGVMPRPRLAGGRVLWSPAEIAEAFLAIPARGEAARGNSWDDAT